MQRGIDCVGVSLQVKSITFAQELFDKADTNNDGKLTLEELCDVLREASKVCYHHHHPASDRSMFVWGVRDLNCSCRCHHRSFMNAPHITSNYAHSEVMALLIHRLHWYATSGW